jgi:hypothetical protein
MAEEILEQSLPVGRTGFEDPLALDGGLAILLAVQSGDLEE